MKARFFLPWATAASLWAAAQVPSAWRWEQVFSVPGAGWWRVPLPAETLSACRPGREDLRLFDTEGKETPFAVPEDRPPAPREAKRVSVSLQSGATRILVETGTGDAFDALALAVEATEVYKAAKVEASDDGERWSLLVEDAPFRVRSGGEPGLLELPAGRHAWLRITLDDRSREAVPVRSVALRISGGAEPLRFPLTLLERREEGGSTRLTLRAPVRHADWTALELEAAEPAYLRAAVLRTREIQGVERRLAVLAEGALRCDPASGAGKLAFSKRVDSRELILDLANGDNAPLSIRGVFGLRRRVDLVFYARAGGMLRLASGNPLGEAPRYDVGALLDTLGAAKPLSPAFAPLRSNRAFREEEAAFFPARGAALQPGSWRRSKAVHVERPGLASLSLDDEVLAASPTLLDLRLVLGRTQVPYLLDRDVAERSAELVVEATHAATKNARVSRWHLRLPGPGLPMRRVDLFCDTPYFRREFRLYAVQKTEPAGERAELLHRGFWRREAGPAVGGLSIAFDGNRAATALLLEVEDGDNPPLAGLRGVAMIPVSRLHFR
ncbi:MAG: hypothetical protein J0L75_03170 [Spirochaetes bacterium]|nr:hypothetical protein [Spirochaetota bacterium]